ncbi:PREDICTED: vomeronasal type-2 receptor 26-like [Nanorana parkeri]|uniref:vomeronasal type-2 receptor 26-like n=1 Tax=Nanorana parkeri TaxID=125878 RepID=UPI000854FDA7|nr:PREDICTED: vomeronasal type-2 receptor 26-like [Nanorana parkeri]
MAYSNIESSSLEDVIEIGFMYIGGSMFPYSFMCRVYQREYRHLLAFIFAIDEINSSPDILPNVTLGYHVYDSCGNVNKATKDVLQILSGHSKTVPNYSCMISYGARDTLLSDRKMFPNLFRTVPDNEMQYVAIVKLLKRLKWNWVGIITSDDEYGEREIQQLSKQLTNHGICIEFRIMHGFMKDLSCQINLLKFYEELIDRNRGRPEDVVYRDFAKALTRPQEVDVLQNVIQGLEKLENCQMCPEDQWPNEARNICVAKCYEYLSYEKDIVVVFFSASSVVCSTASLCILGIFFWFRSTPIVRANNRNLSFILLFSLMLSFLSVFLFLGHPVNVTCMLQQVFFGIVFTVSLSSILAKTIMVFIAFKATRPESSCRKWVGIKLPNTVLLFCSLIQVMIGVFWMSISPPFQEYDMHSSAGKIIIQCNEGSVIGFYCLLGYMGLLAAVSFVLAFMVRTLPDSFNEAKYITFSMLVFCSVWIAMIPAYLSTRGKYTVAVEIFAILTSSAGILVCIFFPKLYILLFKPELNTRKSIMAGRMM